jgi:hypothetical protein
VRFLFSARAISPVRGVDGSSIFVNYIRICVSVKWRMFLFGFNLILWIGRPEYEVVLI